MRFKLEDAVPWGKNLNEYKRMFNLSESDLKKRIISFADGTSSFNSEMSKNKHEVISLDPIYQYEYMELSLWINTVIEQMHKRPDSDELKNTKEFEDIKKIRLQSIKDFIDDFYIGKIQNRYLYYEFPNKTGYNDLSFDIGLCANFLILYSQFGLDFHIKSIEEMLRLCREIRIYPILDLTARRSYLLDKIISYFSPEYLTEIVKVDYGFQDKGYEMLSIKWNG
jgi:hypothetical protein